MSFTINKNIAMISGKKILCGPVKNLRGLAVGNHWSSVQCSSFHFHFYQGYVNQVRGEIDCEIQMV